MIDYYSLVFYGPWDRVKDRIQGGFDYSSYLAKIRVIFPDCEIIYCSSDSKGYLEDYSKLFDKVISTERFDPFDKNTEYNHQTPSFVTSKFNRSWLLINSIEGVKASTGSYILKSRSDLFLKLDFLKNFDSIALDKGKFIVDCSASHSPLIPYYWSDMFISGESKLVKNAFQIDRKKNLDSCGVLQLSPFRYLNIGRFHSSYVYNEYLVWGSILENSKFIKIPNLQSKLLFSDLISSERVMRGGVVIIPREEVFEAHSRFNSKTNIVNSLFNKWYCHNIKHLKWCKYIMFLGVFYKKSFMSILKKIWSILR